MTVTTDKGQGTIYWVVLDSAATAPTAAEIILGQDSTETNVTSGQFNQFAVSSTGVKTASASGFSSTANWRVYFTQVDTAGNISAVVVSSPWLQTIASFTAKGIGGFDGSTTYLLNSSLLTPSPIPNSQKGLVSFWIKRLGGAGVDQYLFEAYQSPSTIKFWVHFTAANVLEIQARDSGGTPRLIMSSSSTTNPFATVPMPNWVHCALWWDLSLTTPTGSVFIDGVPKLSGTHTWDATNSIALAVCTNALVGSQHTPSLKYNGSISEVYVNLHDTLDLSIPANIQKFRSSGGLPVNLGPTGALPTGTQPEVYLGDDNDNTNFGTNNGSKGNFTVAAGALTSVTGPP